MFLVDVVLEAQVDPLHQTHSDILSRLAACWSGKFEHAYDITQISKEMLTLVSRVKAQHFAMLCSGEMLEGPGVGQNVLKSQVFPHFCNSVTHLDI